jgi:C-methyltransferase C-terminal domain/Putative zinc binding domain/Methyltransferase domain
MNTTCIRRNTCRLCRSQNLQLVLPIKASALADSYIPAERMHEVQERYPLDVFLCLDCSHVQLVDVVDPRILFSNYLYVTSVSLGLLAHFQRYADDIVKRLAPPRKSLVIDIGSNEGALLGNFKDHDLQVLGVDAAQNIAAKANAAGIKTIADFFTLDLAREIRREYGTAMIVTANNVFAHSDFLPDMADGIRELLSPNGVFVFEVVYLVDVIRNLTFDTIYHEHLCIHSVKPFNSFFRRHGMELFDVERIPTKGGSIRGFVQLAGGPNPISPSVEQLIELEKEVGCDRPLAFEQLNAKLDGIKLDLVSCLRNLKRQGKRIAGYGASATVTTLMHHFELGDLIEFIVDDDKTRHGLFSPGYHIPILSSAALSEFRPDYVVILAWQYAKPIIQKNQGFLKNGGHFIVPMPKLEVI